MKANLKRGMIVLTIAAVVVTVLCSGLMFSSAAPLAKGKGPTETPGPTLTPTPGGSTFHKEPYLIYADTNTEMMVLWQLNVTAASTLEWGTDTTYSLGSVQTAEYGGDHQHAYTITGLTPGSKYYYRVTASTESSTGSFYAAPSASATQLKFFAYGDSRSNPDILDTVAARMVSDLTADPGYQTLAVHSGDAIHSGDQEEDWDTDFFADEWSNIRQLQASIPINVAMGNHEDSGVLLQKYLPYPFAGERYWSFDYGPAHFVVVDQYASGGWTPGSDQYTWLENDLAGTSKTWIFLVFHKPGWGGGRHPNDTDVQDYIQPLAVQYDVAIIFVGHNHNYARAVVDGVQHVTTGGGGAPLYTVKLNAPFVVAGAKVSHYCRIEIDGDTLTLEAVEPDGTVFDTFTMVK